MVDRIEENIKSSQNYVEKAVSETAAAVKTSKKVRKVSKFKVMSLGGHLWNASRASKFSSYLFEWGNIKFSKTVHKAYN